MSLHSDPSTSARKRLRLTFERAETENAFLSLDDAEPDPIIDAWYQDPYDRPSGYGPTEDVRRRANLEHAMRSRGFAFHRVHPIVSWLMNCHGHHRDFGTIRTARNGRVLAKKKKKIMTSCPKGPADCQSETLVSEHDHRAEYPLSDARSSTAVAEINGDANHVNCESDHQATQEIDDFMNLLDEELDNNRDTETSSQNAGSVMIEKDAATLEDEQIARLERRKRFWDIIYGNAELQMPGDDELFDYLRGVVPTLPRKRWLSSLAGPDLGGAKISISEEHLPDDANLEAPVVSLKPQRKTPSTVEDPKTADWLKKARTQLDTSFSHGFQEKWREIASRQTQVAADEASGESVVL